MRPFAPSLILALFVSSTWGAERVEDRTFRAECDGTEQKYVVVFPEGYRADQPVSVLVALHGHGADRWQFVKEMRGECRGARDVAAAHGLLLVSPDYRAKTSWMGPKAESDLVQILAQLRRQHRVEKVILCGGSMGGTGALTFTALHPDLIDGVVSLNGTANLVEYDKFPEAIAESYGGSKEKTPEEYRRSSAEFFPEKFTMPLAATTSGQDKIVPPESVHRLMKAVGKTNEQTLLIHRPAEGHATSYDDTRAALEFVVMKLLPAP